ncbi:hypothetical protein ACFSN5_03855 [Streptococcus tangpeifui]|nr:hypothetical protein [Streptococcus sp. ZJ373]
MRGERGKSGAGQSGELTDAAVKFIVARSSSLLASWQRPTQKQTYERYDD